MHAQDSNLAGKESSLPNFVAWDTDNRTTINNTYSSCSLHLLTFLRISSLTSLQDVRKTPIFHSSRSVDFPSFRELKNISPCNILTLASFHVLYFIICPLYFPSLRRSPGPFGQGQLPWADLSFSTATTVKGGIARIAPNYISIKQAPNPGQGLFS